MDMSKQPGINIISIILTNEKFERVKIVPKNIDVNVHFDLRYEKYLDSNMNSLLIKTTVKGKSKDIIAETNDDIAYLLEFDYIGMFSIINVEENMPMDTFLKNSAAAIMFPYIREHISSITQKAGLGAVYLKPINIMALIQQSKEDDESSESKQK
jgi:preprotein translocase subunit SecB